MSRQRLGPVVNATTHHLIKVIKEGQQARLEFLLARRSLGYRLFSLARLFQEGLDGLRREL